MERKGLLGTIALALIVIIVLAGFLFYLQVKKNGLQISSGNLVLDIKYNSTDNKTSVSDSLPEIKVNNVTLNPKNLTNSTNSSSSPKK